MQRFLVGLTLFALSLPGFAAEEKQQTEFLRKLFRLPEAQWTEVLKQNAELLDDSFFDRCEARIQWDLEHDQVEDALRFALVGDAAAKALDRKTHYQADLKALFDKQNR